jgi:hypothetical protein
MDETTALCNYAAPMHTTSWNPGAMPSRKPATYSLIQPTIAPLFDTRQAEHSLLEWADSANLNRQDEQPYYQYLKSTLGKRLFAKQSKYTRQPLSGI